MNGDREWLELALAEALQAQSEGEDPVGCVLVGRAGEVLARAHNHIERWNDPTAHAELLAIRAARPGMREREAPRGWTLACTLEPCPMCLGTIVMCHIGTVVWAANDRRKRAHELLSANAYMRTRELITRSAPLADLEERATRLRDEYWVARGRPEMVQPLT